jgi:tRNA pseudouridine55 synthase
VKRGVRGSLDGIVVADKPVGVTSQTLVSDVSRATGCGKAGHSGTLDKFASGVLLVLSGRYTRLARFFMSSGKRYRALVAFGERTDTLDPYGEIVERGPLPDEDALRSAIPSFEGEILQVPPEYSAVHVNGKRAYALALKGEDISLKPRPVRIDSIRLISFADGKADIEVACGPGTYIRALARDIAIACGTCAHLVGLRRTYAGGFDVAEAIPLETMGPSSLRPFTPPMAERIGLGTAFLSGSEAEAFKLGRGIPRPKYLDVSDPARPYHAVFDSVSGLTLGVIRDFSSLPAFEAVFGEVS